MAQFLKDDVARELRAAALRVFARQGYRAASMADIARDAGISTGNVYRYFANKEVLFDDVVPRALQAKLLALLEERVRQTDRPGFAVAAEALTTFSLTHRLELVVMLGRAEGTAHEGFAERVRARLEALALEHFGVRAPGRARTYALREIYASFLRVMVNALAEHEDPGSLRAAVQAYARYHGAGLRALFRGGDDEAS